MIKSGKGRCRGHVTHMGKKGNAYRVLVGKPKVSRPFEEFVVDGRMILKWNFGRWAGRAWTGFIGPRNREDGNVF